MSIVSNEKSAHFRAVWPDSLNPALKSTLTKIIQLIWNILSIIIFPIGLGRLGIHYLKNLSFRIIVPGVPDIDVPITGYSDFIKVLFRFIYNPENFKADLSEEGKWLLSELNGQSIKLQAPDGAKIDGAFFQGKNPKKAILYAGGNAEQWEVLYPMLNLLKPLNTSLLAINARGVGKSEGIRSQEGYALDFYTAYEYLIFEHKIDPEDILVIGFSMGGALTACGASLIQEKYPMKKIKAINISSFSTLQTEIQELLSRRNGILPFLARLGAKLVSTEIDVKSCWDKLKGEKCIFYNSKDPVILKPASLFKAVKKNPIGETHVIKTEAKTTHYALSNRDEVQAFYRQILQMLKIARKQTEIKGFQSIPSRLDPKVVSRIN